MVRFEEELKEDRKLKRRELERKEQREYIAIKRKRGVFEKNTRNPFSTVLRKMSAREIALKGKGNLNLNNFVFMCDYFLTNENQEALEDDSIKRSEKLHRKHIYEWISKFLYSKRYTKENSKPYTPNDIKRIIRQQFENPRKDKELSKELHHLWSIFDNMFEDFCNPKPRGRFKNMTDKELFDQIREWNEKAKSEMEKERKSQMPLN
jgi:hypothetical protein